MIRLLTNKSKEIAYITCGNHTQVIAPNTSYDLAIPFKAFQLASNDDLLALLAQGPAYFLLNDGFRDLTAGEAIDLIRGYIYQPRQGDGIPVVANAPRDGSEWVIGSHNFCDPCTWFGDSVRVVFDTLTDYGDGYIFQSVNPNWLDMISGRMHNDDIWVQIQQLTNSEDPHGYQVIVKVDDVEKTARDPFATEGGDYEILYDEGAVRFFESQAGKTVTASYSYATTNNFYVRPMPGKVLVIEDAEADISEDVLMADSIAYSAWHYDGYQYIQDMEAKYKRSCQIVTEARGCYPMFNAIGASAAEKQISDIREFRRKSRGMKYNRQSIPFQYSTVKNLRSSYGQEVRVYTGNGKQFEGENVTMTFYCTEKDEE